MQRAQSGRPVEIVQVWQASHDFKGLSAQNCHKIKFPGTGINNKTMQ
jgi:hypothetical protein